MVIVEALVHRAGGRAGPETVSVLLKDGATLAAETEADDHGSGLGGLDAEAGIALRIDHRVLLTVLVQLGRLEVLDDGGVVTSGIGSRELGQGRNGTQSKCAQT